MRRERTVGGKHGHAGRVTLPGGSAGRLAPPDGGGTPSLPLDFAKCGGSRRVVEASPRWRLSQLVRPARRAGPTTGGPQFIAADGESGAGGEMAVARERDEALEVPAAALREALVNAFAHREYGDTRTVYLAVYADRVEIKSPGGFPTSFDMERLYDPPVCDSNPRNPRIAHVLYLCKMIETWGRGLGVIAKECARAGLPLPVTTMRWGYAVTTFRRPKIDASGSNLDQDLDRADPDPIQIDSCPDGNLARRLLSTIRRNPLISRKLLAVELSVSERKIRDSLRILRDSGVIARQGPDHGGIWRISRRVAPNGDVSHGASEVAENTDQVAEKQGKIAEKVAEKQGKVAENVAETRSGYTEKVTEKLSETEERIVALIQSNAHITQKMLSEAIGLTRQYVGRCMDSLQARKIIRRIGPDKGGYWEVLGIANGILENGEES